MPVSARNLRLAKRHRSPGPTGAWRLLSKIDVAQQRLARAGILQQLSALAESSRPDSDEAIEPLNRACASECLPFSGQWACSITMIDRQPAGELAVTSPGCRLSGHDESDNPGRFPLRFASSTALSLLWADLTPPHRLIPLPLAIDWAKRHPGRTGRQWAGTELFEKAIDKIGRYLGQGKGSARKRRITRQIWGSSL